MLPCRLPAGGRQEPARSARLLRLGELTFLENGLVWEPPASAYIPAQAMPRVATARGWRESRVGWAATSHRLRHDGLCGVAPELLWTPVVVQNAMSDARAAAAAGRLSRPFVRGCWTARHRSPLGHDEDREVTASACVVVPLERHDDETGELGDVDVVVAICGEVDGRAGDLLERLAFQS